MTGVAYGSYVSRKRWVEQVRGICFHGDTQNWLLNDCNSQGSIHSLSCSRDDSKHSWVHVRTTQTHRSWWSILLPSCCPSTAILSLYYRLISLDQTFAFSGWSSNRTPEIISFPLFSKYRIWIPWNQSSSWYSCFESIAWNECGMYLYPMLQLLLSALHHLALSAAWISDFRLSHV